MSRTLSEIYNEAKQEQMKRMELVEIQNDSKMSVLDAIMWVVCTCIWSFENILDVFCVDVAKDLKRRINGTPEYFKDALLKYQYGDSLVIKENGLGFGYKEVDETKRIISQVAYSETLEDGFRDVVGLFSVVKEEEGKYVPLAEDELGMVREYLRQISFVGQHMNVISRIGDILIPNFTVYYDGTVSEDDIRKSVFGALESYLRNVGFSLPVFVQKLIDVVQAVEHVTDISLDSGKLGIGGFYAVSFDDDGNVVYGDKEGTKIVRYFVPKSGYMRQSTGKDADEGVLTWAETVQFVVDNMEY